MIALAAVFTGLGVALGAFGAHALRPTLEANGRLDEWGTAVSYQLVHGIALLSLGIWMRLDAAVNQSRSARMVGSLWMAGIICFSGSLYALSLGAPVRFLWPITPLGGLCFLAGWSVLAVTAARGIRSPADAP